MPVQWTLILPALGGKETQQIDLAETMKVGRAGRNDVVVEDSGTSSSHATFEVRGEELFIRDHGSTNGTAIDDGPRLSMGEWTPVPSGATLRLGVIQTRVVGKPLDGSDVAPASFARLEPAPATAWSSSSAAGVIARPVAILFVLCLGAAALYFFGS